MYKVYEKFEVSAAHRLMNYEGKCHNLHGHNYIIEVWITTDKLDEQDFVMDFTEMKKVVMSLDHSFLNEKLDMENPTAEKIAEWIKKQLEKPDFKVKVRVWEDKDSYAEVE